MPNVASVPEYTSLAASTSDAVDDGVIVRRSSKSKSEAAVSIWYLYVFPPAEKKSWSPAAQNDLMLLSGMPLHVSFEHPPEPEYCSPYAHPAEMPTTAS